MYSFGLKFREAGATTLVQAYAACLKPIADSFNTVVSLTKVFKKRLLGMIATAVENVSPVNFAGPAPAPSTAPDESRQLSG
jgi:hypothetical protein